MTISNFLPDSSPWTSHRLIVWSTFKAKVIIVPLRYPLPSGPLTLIGRDAASPPGSPRRLYIFFFKINKFIYLYFWLCWVFVAAHGLSLAAASGA